MKLFLMLFLCIGSSFASKLEVTASILPQKYFIEQIAKDKVTVNVMVRPGFSPATYEPKTSQMRFLAKSKAYFSVGVPFETVWLKRFKAANKSMLVMDTSKGIEKLAMAKHEHHDEDEKEEAEHHDEHDDHGKHDSHEDHDEHDDHGKHESHDDHDDHEKEHAHDHEGGLDPHIWLDPILVKVQAKTIYDTLVLIDAKNKAFYEKNYQEFLKEMDELHMNIQGTLKNAKDSAFMVFHPSWGYFAKRYDLEQIAVEKEGKEPKPKELIELTYEAKKHAIKVVFVAPQFSQKAARTIAKSIGGNVINIDPLSYDYANNLRNVAKGIAKSYQ